MAKTLIATDTSDGSDASLGFTSGIDDTYDVYEFHFTNIHPETDTDILGFQVNADGGSGFNETITSTYFTAYNTESDSGADLFYDTGYDQAEGDKVYQVLAWGVGNDNDESASGILTLYGPSSDTYVKHFMATVSTTYRTGYVFNNHIAGYINTTTAITQIDFKFASDEIQGGEIKMFGVS